jgi:hypothetical protein
LPGPRRNSRRWTAEQLKTFLSNSAATDLQPHRRPEFELLTRKFREHIEIGKALYSIPGELIGARVKARRDRTTVKLYFRGELVKVHPRKAAGQRSTDPADLPTGTEIYATRDLDRLRGLADEHGDAIGIYAAALLDTPLPWTKMRQVYRLLGLVKKWGAARVEQACQRALDAEAVDVNLVSRMLERGREGTEPDARPDPVVIQGRFARDPSEFATKQVRR